MASKQNDYASYLLRLWKVEEDGQVIWRASLEDTRKADRRNFSSLAALIAFLQAEFGPAACQGSDTRGRKDETDR